MLHYLLGRLPGTGEQRDSRLGLRDLMLGGIGGDMGPGPQFRMIDTRLGHRLRTGRVRMGTNAAGVSGGGGSVRTADSDITTVLRRKAKARASLRGLWPE